MEEVVFDTTALAWQKLEKFPGEGQAKVLREEQDGGAKTMIVKLPGDSLFFASQGFHGGL